MDLGFTAFKVKVGQDLEDDKRRCASVRRIIGPKNILVRDQQKIIFTFLRNFSLLWLALGTEGRTGTPHINFYEISEVLHLKTMVEDTISSKWNTYISVLLTESTYRERLYGEAAGN